MYSFKFLYSALTFPEFHVSDSTCDISSVSNSSPFPQPEELDSPETPHLLLPRFSISVRSATGHTYSCLDHNPRVILDFPLGHHSLRSLCKQLLLGVVSAEPKQFLSSTVHIQSVMKLHQLYLKIQRCESHASSPFPPLLQPTISPPPSKTAP